MSAANGTSTILVVDDEPDVTGIVRSFLERAGYTVLATEKPGEAIALFERTAPGVALLLTDVGMPGMTGLQLADYILGLQPGLPVLFMSGVHTHADRGLGCLVKPFTRAELLGRVGRALRHNGAAK